MKITISKQGVDFEIEAEEILKELFRDENKGLWELKRALDKLDSEITEVEFDEPEPLISDKDIERIMGMPDIIPLGKVNDKEIYRALQGDVILPPSPQKPPTVKKKKSKRRRRINPVTGKRYYHRKRKKSSKFVVAKNHKPIVNNEDDPIIPPAKRPSNRTIELNV